MIIRPSLLAANPLKLYDAINQITELGIHHLHIDMMDYHYTPNFGLTPSVIKHIMQDFPTLTLDVHLMTNPTPIQLIDELLTLGIQDISLHFETLSHLTQQKINEWSKQITIRQALSPNAPLPPNTHNLLILAVSPGFCGQAMNPLALQLLKDAKHQGKNVIFDGGVNLKTAQIMKNLQPDSVVIGSGIFQASTEDRTQLITQLMGPQDSAHQY